MLCRYCFVVFFASFVIGFLVLSIKKQFVGRVKAKKINSEIKFIVHLEV